LSTIASAAEYNVPMNPDKIFGILSEPDIIKDRKLSRKNRHGCGQTQEKATGVLPIAQSYQEPYPTRGSSVPDTSV